MWDLWWTKWHFRWISLPVFIPPLLHNLLALGAGKIMPFEAAVLDESAMPPFFGKKSEGVWFLLNTIGSWY
jgi:hypothetical protein